MKNKISYKIQQNLQNGAFYEYDNYIIIILTDTQYKFLSKLFLHDYNQININIIFYFNTFKLNNLKSI